MNDKTCSDGNKACRSGVWIGKTYLSWGGDEIVSPHHSPVASPLIYHLIFPLTMYDLCTHVLITVELDKSVGGVEITTQFTVISRSINSKNNQKL